MAKFKVLKKFKDTHTKEVYQPKTEIEMTVKRAEEVEQNLNSSFLERIDNKSEKDESTKELKEDKEDKE